MQQQYNEYDAIAFAEEPSFIRWVRHKEPKAKAFWEKWLKKHPEKASIIKEATILVQAIQIKEVAPAQSQIDGLWNKIDKKIKEEVDPLKAITKKEETPIRKLRPMRWLGYVAAAAVAALLFFQVYNPTTSVLNGKGDHLAHSLPDQSKIELNADSKIAYQAKNWSKERVVELEGEAFFEVEKGVSFKVVTPNGIVEVLGTSFNVNARNGNLVVDCKTGKVRVSAKGDQEVLTPGKGTRLNDNKTALVDTYPSNVDQKMAWRNGQFYFENVTLAKVITELERQFDVHINASPALLDRKGDYNFQGDLKTALNDVFYQLNATPVINGKEVTIK